MTVNMAIWTVVFFALTAGLLLLPFYPAWREWRYPTDAKALPLPDPEPEKTAGLPAELQMEAAGTPSPMLQATQRISVPVGAAFLKLVAPTIELGQATRGSASIAMAHKLGWVRTTPLLSLPNAKTWGEKGWRVNGSCQVPDAHHLLGPLVVRGPLHIGADCVVEGDIKAHGAVKIGPRSLVTGSVFSPHEISLAKGAWVHGPVMSEDRIVLSDQCVVGRITQPATVCARQIEASSGARVHGTLWARESGRLK